MTRKEAREAIKEAYGSSEYTDEIIKALEQEPCEDMGEVSGGIIWEDVDKEEIAKAVMLLDLFTKTFCRYRNDYERFEDLKFRCEKCLFRRENGGCLVKLFRTKYAPNYRDFGSMGEL